MKTHHKIQQYVCSQCPRKYHTVTQLNHHLANHHGIVIKTQIAPRGDYLCNVCPASFEEDSLLKRHVQKHAEGRFIQCPVVGCIDGFSTKNQLNKHLQNQHPHEHHHRKKESKHVPLSMLQLSGNSKLPTIKIEDDGSIAITQQQQQQQHITQIPIQSKSLKV